MQTSPATVADTLRVHGDLNGYPTERIHDHWAKLDHRLRSFRDDAVQLDLYVKNCETPAQHLVLEATIARWPKLVATADGGTLEHALNIVRDEMIRQITEAKNKHEPSHNRRLRNGRRA